MRFMFDIKKLLENWCAKIYSRRNSTKRPVENCTRFARIPSKLMFTILLQVDVKRWMDKTVSYPLVFKRLMIFVSVFFSKDGHTINFSTSREYRMTCCNVGSLHNSVCCCFALLRSITTWRHEISCGVLFFFEVFSAKQVKKAREKRNQYSFIEQNALSDNYMENIIKRSYPKMTGETRVWPVKSTIMPDIVCWPAIILRLC